MLHRRKAASPPPSNVNEACTENKNSETIVDKEQADPKIVNRHEKNGENEPAAGKLSLAKRIAVMLVKGLAVLCIAPPLLNYSALSREGRELVPADAEMVEVAPGQKLLKRCVGTGSPTVILDAAGGLASNSWSLVQEMLAKSNRVCAYDRAGLGFSDRPFRSVNQTTGKPGGGGGMHHTVENMVDDFQRLFSSEKRPFVVVGAGQGGLVTKFYAQMFPDSVSGVVLINPFFEGLFMQEVKDTPWTEYWERQRLPTLQFGQMMAAVGITRIALQLGVVKDSTLEKNISLVVMNRRKHALCKPAHLSTAVEEAFHLNESLTQMRILQKLRPFPEKVPASIVWTDTFHADMTSEQTSYWQSTQNAFHQTFGGKDVVTMRVGRDMEDLLFNRASELVECVRNVFQRWRTRRTEETSKF